MLVRVLGPVEVLGTDGWVSLAPRQRTLLALLLIGQGPVSTDRLAEEIWGEQPPRDPVNQLTVHVSRIRRVLDDPEGNLLRTRSRGYELVVDNDLRRFEELAAERKPAEALALWRGGPFAPGGGGVTTRAKTHGPHSMTSH